MIGKFLEDEENKPEEISENTAVEPENTADADVLTLPETQPDVFSLPETFPDDSAETTVFRESQEVVEAIPLPENQETYTVSPDTNLNEQAVPVSAKPQTSGESIAVTARRTGLAWTAGTVLVGTIGFMLILGWFADLLLGSSPWGVVVGIVLGAIIGFIQLFRITSQIFKTDE